MPFIDSFETIKKKANDKKLIIRLIINDNSYTISYKSDPDD